MKATLYDGGVEADCNATQSGPAQFREAFAPVVRLRGQTGALFSAEGLFFVVDIQYITR